MSGVWETQSVDDGKAAGGSCAKGPTSKVESDLSTYYQANDSTPMFLHVEQKQLLEKHKQTSGPMIPGLRLTPRRVFIYISLALLVMLGLQTIGALLDMDTIQHWNLKVYDAPNAWPPEPQLHSDYLSNDARGLKVGGLAFGFIFVTLFAMF